MLTWLFSILLSLGIISGTAPATSSNDKANDRNTQVDDQPEGGDEVIIGDYIIK